MLVLAIEIAATRAKSAVADSEVVGGFRFPTLALAIKIAATRAKFAVADSEVVESEPATAGFVFLAAVSTARIQRP
jgi:hypothetical protein